MPKPEVSAHISKDVKTDSDIKSAPPTSTVSTDEQVPAADGFIDLSFPCNNKQPSLPIDEIAFLLKSNKLTEQEKGFFSSLQSQISEGAYTDGCFIAGTVTGTWSITIRVPRTDVKEIQGYNCNGYQLKKGPVKPSIDNIVSIHWGSFVAQKKMATFAKNLNKAGYTDIWDRDGLIINRSCKAAPHTAPVNAATAAAVAPSVNLLAASVTSAINPSANTDVKHNLPVSGSAASTSGLAHLSKNSM